MSQTFVEVVLETANGPESHKRGLVQDREVRANMLRRHFTGLVVHMDEPRMIVAVQESGTYLQRECAKGDRWRASYAKPNEHIKERTAGNGQISTQRTLPLLASATITTPRTGRGDDLNLPVRVYGITDDVQLAVIGFHAQTRRSDPLGTSRRRLYKKVQEASKHLEALGYLVVVMGDANIGKASWARKYFSHLLVAGRHGVDWILVSRGIKVLDKQTHHLPLVSDHDFLSVLVGVPAS